MATINLGKVAPVYKGTYVVGTYNKFEVVFDGESSFISLKDNNSAALSSDGVNWLYLCRGNANSALMKTDAANNEFRATAASLSELNGRIQALEEFIKNATFDTLQVNTLNTVEMLNIFKNSNLIKVGTPRMIGFDFATGGTFTLTVDGVTTAPIVYTNASTFASVTTQITDALTAIGKTITLGYSVTNGTTYILLKRDYDGETNFNYSITDASSKVKKTATPIDAPDFVGQFFIDNIGATTNSWQAMNVNSVSDWKQITN